MNFMQAREALESLLDENNELNTLEIAVNSRALKSEEAIGIPDRDDFPLLRGKEVLLQAEIEGALGQAFTADPIAYHGPLHNLLKLTAERPGNQAMLVSSLNALLRKLGKIEHTVHCTNHEPEECAKHISQYILEKHGLCNIGIIGYQPAILANCVKLFGKAKVKITD